MDREISLFQSNDETIRHSLLNLTNKYLLELTGKSLSSAELLNVEQLLFSLLEDEKIDSLTLKTISFILKKILNSSLFTFLSLFDLNTVKFIEKVIVLSIHNQDYNSQVALKDSLESILLLTSNKIPQKFSEKVKILFENFNLSIFNELIKNCIKPIPILSIQCISNFILGGFINRILASKEILILFSELLEIGDFEIKQETLFLFSNIIEISPVNCKLTFLSDRKFLSSFCNVLPTLDTTYVLGILKALLNSLSQLVKTENFKDVISAFNETEFLHIFELIDYENKDDVIPEIHQIYELFITILS